MTKISVPGKIILAMMAGLMVGALFAGWWFGWSLLPIVLLLAPPVLVLAFIGFQMGRTDESRPPQT